MLSPYCVLDLADEKGLLAGKVLADLGADVIKIEPPSGNPSRKLGPFYQDKESPENSLYWMAYNTSKRGITLNLEKPRSQDLFRGLIKKADFVIESFPPDYMEKLGIDYHQLKDTNPQLIWSSITPFGRTGSYKDYQASDLITMAMGGVAFITGDENRPPLRLALNQSYTLAGIHCVSACLTALMYRNATNQGQHIDISIQEAIATTLWSSVPIWEFLNINEPRMGNKGTYGNFVFMREVWQCKDGYVVRLPIGGLWGAQDWGGLASWMEEDGVIGSLKGVDWASMDTTNLSQQQVDAWEADMARFFLLHTKVELEDGAAKRGMKLIGVQTVPDIMNSKHLHARSYWKELDHSELKRTIIYPGYYFQSDKTKHGPRSRAPHIGEHNKEVYKEKLGLSAGEVESLKQQGVI
ncbi:MAG: CoA transferase [Chloroflexi bacterium]|nr:CoA transferase [Chloroflexota bacterium]MBM3173544.1 CoA transferase [Chloroflexota bacterium]MBM3174338.1 CoA transferase [Chloroflexota bacterium]